MTGNHNEQVEVQRTIFHTEGAGILQSLFSVLAGGQSLPGVSEGRCCALYYPLWGLHVIRQDHIVVPT